MELHAVDGELAVAQAHDFALGGFGGDFERGGEGLALDEQGVVARGFEGIGQAGEDAGAVVQDGRGLSVHEPASADDVAAEDVADALVAEANAEQRGGGAETSDDFVADAGFVRRARTGGDADALRLERGDFVGGDFVVPFDQQVGA